MLTPADIDKKQFATTRLKEGYDQDEVDAFLDRVVSDYSGVLQKLEEARREIDRLQRTLANSSSNAVTTMLPLTPVGSAEKILIAAQRTADQVEEEAKADASRVRSEANNEAGGIRASARAEAENLKNVAETERQRILNLLESERADLEEKIEILKAKRSSYKTWLRSSLAKIEEEETNGS